MDRIIIFGGTGSLGRKLIERYIIQPSTELLVYSRDEAKHWTIRNEMSSRLRSGSVRFMVGDIRNPQRVKHAVWSFRPTTIIIAAALKQVDTCELSPDESVATNLQGTQNVVQAAREYSVLGNRQLKVLFVSTDKACAPVNVYGMCKAISERIVTSSDDGAGITYLCTRYGNVLESRGSIIPLFKYQSIHGDELTVTDPDMTRFVMTLDDSVDLIQHTLAQGRSGETWIPRIPAMRIGDLASIFSEESGKPVRVVGLRPGEKQHEDLINESESVRSRLTADGRHYVIGPALGCCDGPRFTYSSSQDVMTLSDLRQHLSRLGILEAPLEAFRGREIEEIRT